MLGGGRKAKPFARLLRARKERNQRLAEFSNFDYRVVTISGSSNKLRDQRQVRPNLIIADWLPVMTDGGIKRVMHWLKPFGQQRQLDSGLNGSIVREDREGLGHMPTARQ